MDIVLFFDTYIKDGTSTSKSTGVRKTVWENLSVNLQTKMRS